MLDRNLIRTDPDKVREGLRRKGCDERLVDRFLEADTQWRAVKSELDEKRASLKRLSAEIGRLLRG